MIAPTPRQLEVLRVMARSRRERGIYPTLREVCHSLGFASTNAVAEHLYACLRRGLVEHHEPPTGAGNRIMRPWSLTSAGWKLVGATHELIEPQRCELCGAEFYGQHSAELCASLFLPSKCENTQRDDALGGGAR